MQISDYVFLIIISAIVLALDMVSGSYYKRITGKEILSIIPFYETFILIKLLIKIKKESNNNADDK